jgi:hypothetical protein
MREWTLEQLNTVHPLNAANSEDRSWGWEKVGQIPAQPWVAVCRASDGAYLDSVWVEDGDLHVQSGPVPEVVSSAVGLVSRGMDSLAWMALQLESDAEAHDGVARITPGLAAVSSRGVAEGCEHAAAMLRRGRVRP